MNRNQEHQESGHGVGFAFAGHCSILMGISYLLVGVFLIIDPSHKQGVGIPFYYEAVAASPMLTVIRHLCYGFGALLGLAVVPALSRLIADLRPGGWFALTRGLAYLALSVTAVDSFRLASEVPARAHAFMAGDETTRAVIMATENVLRLDPNTWVRFGALGVWLLTAGVLATRTKLPKALGLLGAAAGFFLLTTVGGITWDIKPLVMGSVVLGGFVALPAWFIWGGIRLRATDTGTRQE